MNMRHPGAARRGNSFHHSAQMEGGTAASGQSDGHWEDASMLTRFSYSASGRHDALLFAAYGGLLACGSTGQSSLPSQTEGPDCGVLGTPAGTLISAGPSAFSTDDLFHVVDDSVASWQLLYATTSATGEPAVASATVLVPRAAANGDVPRAIVAYTPGATGMADACAPSRQMIEGTFVEDGILKTALDRGWALVVMDYPGIGTPGQHPYSVNRALAFATLDGLRAALSLEELELSAETPIGVWGYSEGGGAAVATAELAPTYAPELALVGVAAGGVSSNLLENAAALEGQATFVPSVLIAIGFDVAYPELALDHYLTAYGQREFAAVREKCIIPAMLQFAYRRMSDYTVRSPFDDPAYRQRLHENRLGQFAPHIPVYLYHAENDEAVPLRIALSLRDAYCAMGVVTTFERLQGATHLGGQAEGYPGAADWLARRFAGAPAQSNCGL